jgi:hypothetical protein
MLAPFILQRPQDPTPATHSARAHSVLSASGASRWMNCPGSVAACRDTPEGESIYSAEGQAAHELAERCLAENRNAGAFVGQMFDTFEVTPDRAAGVQIYLDECRRVFDAADTFLIEHVVSLEQLNPPAAMFGTCDAIAYSRKRHELHIIDLKYGKGVWVSAKDNPQLLYYALGAVLALGEPVSRINMTIVQPRFAGGDPIRGATVDAIALSEWSFTLIDHARAALAPDASLVAGAWCRFCPAKNSCPARRLAKAEAAFREFSLADGHAAGA